MGFAKGALSKLTIFTFLDPEKKPIPTGVFSVMYNPDKFSISHSNSSDNGKSIILGEPNDKFLHRNPRSLKMELFFDGTESSPSDIKGFGINTLVGANQVDLQIKEFLAATTNIEGSIHRTPYLVFVWGTFIFPGIIESADVSYSLFSSDGRPLRARVNISVKEAASKKKYLKVLNLLSPDLTHVYTVKQGDRLDLLCDKFYEDTALYYEIASINNLKNPRRLTVGQTLVFPPIDKTE